MPTYEYVCPACGARFETWQKMTDDPLTTCPTCGGAIHRVLYPAGIVFKGGGFYSTDHRHEGGAKAEQSSTTDTPAASTATATDGSGASSGSGGTPSSGGSSGTATNAASKPAAAPPKD